MTPRDAFMSPLPPRQPAGRIGVYFRIVVI